jgi:hypothetical protein
VNARCIFPAIVTWNSFRKKKARTACVPKPGPPSGPLSGKRSVPPLPGRPAPTCRQVCRSWLKWPSIFMSCTDSVWSLKILIPPIPLVIRPGGARKSSNDWSVRVSSIRTRNGPGPCYPGGLLLFPHLRRQAIRTLCATLPTMSTALRFTRPCSPLSCRELRHPAPSYRR